jgi:hypothetical protein
MFLRPFYAFFLREAFFCSSAHQDHVMLIRPFYAYHRGYSPLCLPGIFMLISRRVAPFRAYHCGKKIKLIYLKTTLFSRAVCPV